MRKVIIVLGPTAVGKTKIGIELAKRLNTEIISGDSVQVYKGLDIGSAKATIEEMAGVKHHLIDILDAKEDYSVCDFQKQARELTDNLDIPMIVGGTGLYIKAAISNYEFDAPKRDFSFESQFDNLSNEELYDLLKEKDPKMCEIIHPNNRKRVLRALFASMADEPLSEKNGKDTLVYDPYIIYLNLERQQLYDRINKRVDIMINDGLEEEVRNLYEKGITPHAIGYQEWLPYFRGEVSFETVVEEIKKNSRHLAKRQITWFKHQMDTKFYDVNLENINETIDKIYEDVLIFLKEETK
jgi:tRNA dimethylallyltransferase